MLDADNNPRFFQSARRLSICDLSKRLHDEHTF